MSEDILATGRQQLSDVRNINRDLIEKALHMRCLGYIAQAKANLLTQTIYEIDASKKTLLQVNEETIKQRELIAKQKQQLEKKNKDLESLSQKVQQRMLLYKAQTPLALIEWNSKLEITDWNPAAERIFGYNYHESVGQSLVELVVDEKEREDTKQQWLGLVENKKSYHRESKNITKQGKVRICNWYNTPLVDGDGQLIAVASLVEDITERKQTEEALRRAQKMEAIGQLTGGIAHDFNNQLGIIVGYLDFLKDYLEDDKTAGRWVDTTINAANRCIDLTRQLLVFSRKQSNDETIVDINTALKETDTIIARTLTPEVNIQYFLGEDLWQTKIDPGEFKDAVLNLVINARDAMSNGGTLIIETTNKHLDSDSNLHPDIKPGDYVQLMISDTGEGMDKNALEHIFEPFFTTKPEGKGTGLGMAMVYGFVNRHAGFIKVYSEPGIGTTIRLYLPRAEEENREINTKASSSVTLPSGSETILIVDDEVDLLHLAENYLSSLGYQTLIAENALQALDICSKNKHVDLLFTDVVMPGGMNGYELAQKLIQYAPDLKVLLTSGFTSRTISKNQICEFSDTLLNKPYTKSELAQRIRQVLDENVLA